MNMTCFSSNSLVVIDSAVLDYQHLIAGLHPDQEILVLDSAQDGVEQIARRLQHRQNLTSLHIVSHGQPGALTLGATQLSFHSLTRYAALLQQWAQAFQHQASILLYSCQVAASQQGQALVQKLHELTGASVAASTTLVGAQGNWQLDFQVGAGAAEAVFNPQVLAAYPHTLAVFVAESFRNPTVSQNNWSFGTSGASANPFLTAGTATTAPTGGLLGSPTGVALDAAGSGALRLTNNSVDQSAFVFYNTPFSSTAGLSVTFDFFAYNGFGTGGATPGGDGISFFLIDGAQSPTVSGAFGGSLGYAPKIADGIPGLVGGYVGIGLDEFGNFANPVDFTGGPVQRTGGPGLTPDAVTVRGIGSGLGGYSFVATSGTLAGGIDNVTATSRSAATKRVRLDITPQELLTVRVDLNGDGDFLDLEEAPIALRNIDIRAANGGVLPSTFKFGFASSTGNATNIHEIRNLVISTFSTPPTVSNTTIGASPNSLVNLVGGLIATDAEAPIANFTITSLPAAGQGVLFLGNPLVGGTAVTPGQVLTPAQISQLFFQAGPGFTGSSFTYSATDADQDTSQVPGVVSLVLIPNPPPTVGDGNINITSNQPTGIGPLPVSDPNGITSITIVTIPPAGEGTLFLGQPGQGGTPVTVGQVIPQSQTGQLFFQPGPNFNGSNFTFTATDSLGKVATTPGRITLVDAISTTPIIPTTPGCQPGETIRGTNGNNTLVGTPDNDTLIGRSGNDRLRGKACDDRINGGRGNDRAFGNDGNDRLRGQQNNDRLDGGKGIDLLEGGLGRDRLRGRLGNDIFFGGRGNDTMIGNAGADRMSGGLSNDDLDGGDGNDTLSGDQGNDRLRGRTGTDNLDGAQGDDRLDGGAGNDVLNGGLQSDRLLGRAGVDTMFGRRGKDRLKGGSQGDIMDGGVGNDTLIGGGGRDTLTGGGGRDRFVYRNVNQGPDTILDFEAAEDTLGLRRIFASGDYSRRPIFDRYIRLRASGSDTIVRVDSNGDAAGGFVRLATLVGVAPDALTASNFVV